MIPFLPLKKKEEPDFPKPNIWKLPKNLWLRGIIKGSQLIGPHTVQVDLTNNCNMTCVGCWCHSDLLKETKFDANKKKQELSFEKFKELITDLAELGTEEIQLAGSGDPSLYPNFIQAAKFIKKKGLKVSIITNFSLIDLAKIPYSTAERIIHERNNLPANETRFSNLTVFKNSIRNVDFTNLVSSAGF